MNLKQYMTKTNIGYRELAKKAGVHHTTIFSFINGRTKTFRPEIAKKLHLATDKKVSFLSLVTGESDSEPS